MYMHAPSGFGHTLAQSISKPLPGDLGVFLAQVRNQPETKRVLLATVILHPRPMESRFWGNQNFMVGKQLRYLIDALLFEGVEGMVVLDALRQISSDFQRTNPRFRKQIEAAVTLRGDIMNALSILGQDLKKLQPYVVTVMLPSSNRIELENERLIRLGHSFAKERFPAKLADRMLHTLTFEVHYVTVARWLQRYAEVRAKRDPAFRRQVEEKLKLMLDTKDPWLKRQVQERLKLLKP